MASPPPRPPERMVVMGRIAAPHGVKGWVKVQPFTGEPDALCAFARWWLRDGDGWREAEVEESAGHGAWVIAKLAGISTRDDAAAVRNREVAIPREALPEAAEGEFYWIDLIGMTVRNLADESLGRVESMMHNGAQSILVVRGEREHLIPFVDQFVREVDRSAGRIVVDWGLDY